MLEGDTCDAETGIVFSRDKPRTQPTDLSNSPPRPIEELLAEASALCDAQAAEEGARVVVAPTPQHPLGDAVHRVGSREWRLRQAEAALQKHLDDEDIFGEERIGESGRRSGASCKPRSRA
jgi:hypothetical protein